MTLFSSHFKKPSGGLLILALPDGSKLTFGSAGPLGEVNVQIHNLDFFYEVAFHSDIGLGDSYVQELFDCNDLTAFYELLLTNLNALAGGNWILSSLSRLLAVRSHRLNQNSKSQSKKNISAHYDLSNEFFHAFLSPDRNYSCALFTGEDCSLETAQIAKMDAMLALCGIKRHQHLLEIGSGWGGLAIHAAKTLGCRVTSITLSEEQLQYCQKRIRHLRLDHLVDVQLLENCRGTDWIRHRIFPGGHCPSLKSILTAIEPIDSLRMISAQEIGKHYGETLRRWRENLKRSAPELGEILPHLTAEQINSLHRTFLCYFSYCEAGFNQGYTSTWQLGFERRG